MMRRLILLPALWMFAVSCAAQQVSIIPQPVSIQTTEGRFTITSKTVIAARDEQDWKTAAYLNTYLKEVYGFTLDIDPQETKNYIRLTTKKFIQAPDKDGYQLTVDGNGIAIDGDTYAGTFYGLQSLIQLLPVSKAENLIVPFVTISDYPAFKYRGMHLDVCRHFFPVSFVKKYIDYIALHKMNYFHWHLTDDQGWRVEIKKYPELTQKGAFRKGTIIGRYPGTGNDNIPYGGYYTQDQVKEIVQYAADRHITVIPEIEMPGHASAAIAAYPWLSCFPEEETKVPKHPSDISKRSEGKKVQESWGIYDDVFCAGNDSVFTFLQDVADELIPLFPSAYFHVGGDECPKSNWKKCPRCQARKKEVGLKDEHELQSYFVQRMEQHLNQKGKTIIGWDEILEGGLAPKAVVMSWRGEEGGISAARQGHYVIMTPGKPVYFDHSQSRNEDSLVIGGYNSLEAVYKYNPIPKELKGDAEKYVMGAQANVWTEYMAYDSKVEYMIFPRMSALAEVLWTPADKKDWKDFTKRLQDQFQRYELWKANSSKAYYDVKVSLLPAPGNKGIQMRAEMVDSSGQIVWGEASGKEMLYTSPVTISRTGVYNVSYKRKGVQFSQIPLNIAVTKATGRKISLMEKPSERYPGQHGDFSLVNGLRSEKGLSSPDWLGWEGKDLNAVIDFGKAEKFSTVRIHTIDQSGSWVYLPKLLEVLTSVDGKTFKKAGSTSEFIADAMMMGYMSVRFPARQARFIKVVAKNYGTIPEGLPGAGNPAWLMLDEIQVL